VKSHTGIHFYNLLEGHLFSYRSFLNYSVNLSLSDIALDSLVNLELIKLAFSALTLLA